MAHGPKYRVPNRRRREGKTNYHKRLRLLKSKKIRCVIRVSNNHVIVQFVESKYGGDLILASAISKELIKKFGWKYNTGNLPAAYLTGILAGLRAKKKNIGEAILDLGIFYHKNRVLAAFKGILKAGIEISYKEKFIPQNLEERINGSHIQEYAKLMNKSSPEKYQQLFSGYINKNNVDPLKINQAFSNTLKKIQSNP